PFEERGESLHGSLYRPRQRSAGAVEVVKGQAEAAAGFNRGAAGNGDAVGGCAGEADEPFFPAAKAPALADVEKVQNGRGNEIDAGADQQGLHGPERWRQDGRARDDAQEVVDDGGAFEL